ncbi:hypothetical protein NECAME_00130 [Necator americanus]|uniref:Uncharacterized protein n=1 Tax=Necator americanus TaxID=51031 RepID=W2U1N8_NECAM|nr:hypothetical protein NECAME_00130 [Necator americanus]ETN87271.1 hypothetical protein NECAME_00130 [Necator americanus]
MKLFLLFAVWPASRRRKRTLKIRKTQRKNDEITSTALFSPTFLLFLWLFFMSAFSSSYNSRRSIVAFVNELASFGLVITLTNIRKFFELATIILGHLYEV